MSAKTVADAAAQASKKYEDSAAAVFPPATAIVEVRDAIFKLADELGIGAEIQQAWFDAGAGARTGAFIGSAIETAATGAALGTGAAIGMAAGMFAGVVLALFSIFGSDDEDAERRARAEHHAALELLLRELDAEGLAREQDRLASSEQAKAGAARWLAGTGLGNFSGVSPATIAAWDRNAETARSFARFYRQLGSRLPATWLRITILSANLARWQATAAGYRASPATKLVGTAAAREAGRMLPALDALITAEQGKLTQAIARAGLFIQPLARRQTGRPTSSGSRTRTAIKLGLGGLAAWLLWRILAA